MKKLLVSFVLIIVILFITSIYLDFGKDVGKKVVLAPDTIVSTSTSTPTLIVATSSEPIISVMPKIIYQGDPVLITITSSTTLKEMLFNNKILPLFNYDGKERAFLAIDFNENKLEHDIKLKLSNGMVLNQPLVVTIRKKEERPLGIPDKLGGNTPEAAKTLVSNLSKENATLNSVKTAATIFWKDAFIFPLKTIFVTDEYGYNRKTVDYTIPHKGTDFRAPVGTEVMAMNKGVVRIAREYVIYGNTIVVDHGQGVNTLYMHLSELKVKEGDTVEIGQVIGLSGKTGYAEQPHLHISIKINGVSIDPMKFMGLFDVI
jgi:murein DD-endopeptidase MepM/ murein hydrolase activator NlpD